MWGVSSRPVWPLEIRAKEHGSITRLVLWHDILKKKVNLSLHFRISQLLTLAHLIVSKTQKHRVGQATVSPVLNFQQLGQSWPLNVTLTVRLVSYWNLSIIPQVQLKKKCAAPGRTRQLIILNCVWTVLLSTSPDCSSDDPSRTMIKKCVRMTELSLVFTPALKSCFSI